ncbi:hypothetical protein CEK28_17140 [Xenophilus sp. AP218F]|nr:hypothetical protein [Chromobacterium sp. ASV5]OWY37405.1 hypothetical protein CEK28_17140 [Xenophilus sp. AP218F]
MAAPSRAAGFSLLETMLALALWLATLAAVSSLHGRALLDGREAWLRARMERAAADLHLAMQTGSEPWRRYEALRLAGGGGTSPEAARHWARFAAELQAAARPAQDVQARVCRGAASAAPRRDQLGCAAQGAWAIRIAWRSRQWQAPGGWREQGLLWPLGEE